MARQAWAWAVEIEQLGGRHFVRTIEDGNVRLRAFDRVPDAEQFAESERVRLNLDLIVYLEWSADQRRIVERRFANDRSGFGGPPQRAKH
jgi:hypothetical protein